jgi:hypothetical protein
MKREVQREVQLSAFNLDRGDVELIWRRIAELFEGGKPTKATISLSFRSERLTFDSLAELAEYRGLRGSVTQFSIEMRHGQRSVALTSGGLFSRTPSIKAEGESDVWCAAAIEAVAHVVNQRRVWPSGCLSSRSGPFSVFWCSCRGSKQGRSQTGQPAFRAV